MPGGELTLGEGGVGVVGWIDAEVKDEAVVAPGRDPVEGERELVVLRCLLDEVIGPGDRELFAPREPR